MFLHSLHLYSKNVNFLSRRPTDVPRHEGGGRVTKGLRRGHVEGGGRDVAGAGQGGVKAVFVGFFGFFVCCFKKSYYDVFCEAGLQHYES